MDKLYLVMVPYIYNEKLEKGISVAQTKSFIFKYMNFNFNLKLMQVTQFRV